MADDDGGIELRVSPESARALAEARHADPFAVLGAHGSARGRIVRTYARGAQTVEVRDAQGALHPLQAIQVDGLFAGRVPSDGRYTLRLHWPDAVQETEDAYAFGMLLDDEVLSAFSAGRLEDVSAHFGAQPCTIDGVDGVRFAVWAPNARRVSVVGDFNSWDGTRHPMRARHGSGVWELFVPRLAAGARYQYEILGPHGLLPLKADPVALQMELPPGTASIVAPPDTYEWQDAEWMATRARRHAADAPISIYELHWPSWRRAHGGESDEDVREALIRHVSALGFTHIELLPVGAHPFGGSWGYQPLGLYAADPRLGDVDALRRFVDRCHGAGLGVIVDWVPAHFPTDAHGLAHFDGTPLYEHGDPREGFHQDWNTLIYNFGRHEVMAHLIGSALHWIRHYHLDGLRVDAVASMLYRDYSRREGEWIPNRDGGRENYEAIRFLRQLNTAVQRLDASVMTIAEESTAWPGVTQAVAEQGLGFSYKWNMGWMHDTLRYMQHDPVHRAFAHDDMTFGLVYAHSERFILPLSHDEVVHGKGSLYGRMPGDSWQRHANLRAYYGFMWTHPGKKLLFMGGELAQAAEWNHDSELDWRALKSSGSEGERRRGLLRLIGDLNRLYREEAALHASDAEIDGFKWIVGDDRAQSVFAFLRLATPPAPPLLVVCNFTPVPRRHYRIGVPRDGVWEECLNTDALVYGGSGVGNLGRISTQAVTSHGKARSLSLNLPPLATLVLRAPTDPALR